MTSVSTPYIGRFAPSPSGNLHLGSLITALASYLQAKSKNGLWLLRIDDLDTPRNVRGAESAILKTLESHGLFWDQHYRQSERLDRYEANLQRLINANLVFACECTRKILAGFGGVYPGSCRNKSLPTPGHALRFRNDADSLRIEDSVFGIREESSDAARDDFVLRRRDGIYGYHLASVSDDIDMGITEVVRGADLFFPSLCQSALFDALEARIPAMLHVPVASSAVGKKLSKQNHAPAVGHQQATGNLIMALRFLGQAVPGELSRSSVEIVMQWAQLNWQPSAIPAKTEIIL